MGSSGSSQLKQPRSDRQKEPEELPEVFSSFLNTFRTLPLSNRPENTPAVKSLFSRARRLNVKPTGSWLFHKGDPARGIFIVLKGAVDICLEESNGTAVIIKTLTSGACFGELSTLFNIQCSASVRTSVSDTKMLHLDTTLFADFKPQGQDSLLDWCTQRCYIDTANLFPQSTLAVRSVKGCLENVPMFASWSREAIDCLAKLCKPMLFEEGSVILEEGENCLEMCLLISGRVVFTADDEVWRSVAAGPQGYWFGEEGLFLHEMRRCSVKTDLPSQIVVIDRNQMSHVVQQFPNERSDYNRVRHHWEQHRRRLDYSLLHRHKGLLDIEMVLERLQEADDMNGCSRMAAYKIAMEMSVKSGDTGDVLLSSQDISANAFLVVLGVVELVQDSKVVRTLAAGEYYHRGHGQSPSLLVAQLADVTVVALFPFPAVAEALQSHDNS